MTACDPISDNGQPRRGGAKPIDQLVVLVGGSGTGKSTTSRLLQEELLPTQWLRFSTDTILYCLPPSILDAANNRNDWSQIDVRAITRTTMSCLDSLLAAGSRVIYDCVIMTEWGARELVAALQAYQPLLVVLTCSWEETERRTSARGDRTLEEAEHGFKTASQHLEPDCTIDTTGKEPIAVAREVIVALKESSREAWRRNMDRLVTRPEA